MGSFKKSIRYYKSPALIGALVLLFGFEYSGLDLNKDNFFQSNPQSELEKWNTAFSPSALEPSQDLFTLTNSTVNSSSDDAEETPVTGDMSLTSGDLEMVVENFANQTVGIRFNNLNIPQCAPINSAYIQFMAKGVNGNEGICSLTIYGEDSDNATTFTNTDFDITTRSKTNASAIWDPSPWNMDFEAGVAQRTVDISPIIQEIVEREGFSTSSSIVIIIEGIGLRRVYSFDETDPQSVPPTIHINYNPNIPDDDNDGVCDANDLCPGEDEPGTPCDDMDNTTYNDVITSGCICAGTPYDCPGELANIGDSCDDGNPETSNDTITVNCVCLGSYDCPSLQLNIGDPCDDGNPETSNDMVSSNCECSGSYDCPSIPANIGDPCDDGESGTYNDLIDGNCNCVGIWECPGLNLGIGYPCDDGDPTTSSDIVDDNCNCAGLPFICSPISSSTDDAEEEVSNGDISLTSDLELINDNVDQIVGLRFNNIEIPQCAVITNATIQFTSKGSTIDPCNLTFYGENTDNAITFSNDDFDISSRTKTTTSVSWSPAPWENGNETGPLQKTVDLLSIVQEIVNREGFVSGNSIAFIIEGSGTRRAFSFDDFPDPPPELCIEFDPTIPDSDNDGVCDANDLCPGGDGEPGTSCDDGDPNTPNDFVNDSCECVGGYDCTLLMVDFGTPCDDGELGTYNDVIDSSCVCVGTWECQDLMTGYGYSCDDGDPDTVNDAIDSTCTCIGVHLVSVGVTNSDDDAEEEVTGPVNIDSDDLEMIFDDTTQIIGIRFKELGIPHCAVINRAYIQFRARSSTNGPCDLEIYGEASDHALAYVEEDFDISSRLKTDSLVSWSPNPWSSNDVTLDQQTPDLSAIVQEIIERPEFTDTSSIAFIIEGSGLRRAYSYDAGDTLAPMIYIEYFDVFPDDDNDGTCNANDLCPGGPEPGTPCDDLIPETYNDVITFNCECAGIPYDCPSLLANIGDPCDDGDINTPNDFIDSTCNCIGGFDCPNLMLDFGDACDDGISGTYDDMIDSTCMCVGIWDCPEIMAGFDDPCDDGDPSTLDDMINSMCECEGSPTVYSKISSSSDDAEEKETGQVSLTSSDLELVYDGNFQTIGLRFTNLNIPHKARIDTAFIQFTTDEIIDPNLCTLTIYGEKTDDAQTFVDINGDITGRPKTDASVNWSPDNWEIEDEAGVLQRTGNLKPIMKELVNRNGFNTNSSIAFIIEGTGTRTATAYDGKPENAPELYVRYDIPLSDESPIEGKKKNILVYPVPASSNLNLSFLSDFNGEIPIRIFDLNGRMILEESRFVQTGKNDVLFERLDLNNGIYFIQLYLDGVNYMEKFIILKE